MMEKKNADYSASAVKLCNPESIEFLLAQFHAEIAAIQTLNDEIQKLIPLELTAKMAEYQKSHSECETELRKVVDEQGSYQDLDKGWYAVKQRKVSKSYDAGAFKSTVSFGKFVPVVITETVNVKALDGLIKGGLITEADLQREGVIKESESFAYIIK